LFIAGLAVVVVAAAVLTRTRPPPEPAVTVATADAPLAPAPASPPAAAPAPMAAVPAALALPVDEASSDATDGPRFPVDLEVIRRQLPDNLYWTMGAPTEDPEVLEARAREDRRWNTQRGKVLAGEASDDELHAWFAHQRRVHEDYLDFSAHVLNQYGEQLSERDRGLLELSVRMHKDRLDELPRQEADAVARKLEQDRRRAEWEAKGKP
jgi:hypothetical protein